MKFFKSLSAVAKLYRTYPIFKKHLINIHKIRATGDDKAERQAIIDAMNEWSDKAFQILKSKVEVYGQENLPKEGPVVFISNHQGYGDIPTFMKGIRTLQFGFIARDGVKKLPVFGKTIDMIRGLFIKRESPRDALRVIQEGTRLLERGFNMIIFPEGTRSQGDQMGRFKPGSFKLATTGGFPIIPITIDGSYKLYEEHGELRPTTVKFVIHKPIETKGLNRQEQVALVKKVKDIIASGFNYGEEKQKDIFDHTKETTGTILQQLEKEEAK